MRQHLGKLVAALIAVPLLINASGCSSAKGSTAVDKRLYAQNMRTEVLNELYAEKPEARQSVENAIGYGVFTNVGSKVLIIAAGNGYGIVRDNATGQDIYMKMKELGGGLGMGIRKYRAVFVFHDAATMRKFVDEGWEVGVNADAAAKSGDTGGNVAGSATSGQIEGLQVYQVTESGIALSATATAAKYYPDNELN